MGKRSSVPLTNFIRKTRRNFIAWRKNNAIKRDFRHSLVEQSAPFLFNSPLAVLSTLRGPATPKAIESHITYFRSQGVENIVFVATPSAHLPAHDDLLRHYSISYVIVKNEHDILSAINYLLTSYRCQKWTVLEKGTNVLIYPYNNTRSLIDLTDYLTSIREQALSAITLAPDHVASIKKDVSTEQEGLQLLAHCYGRTFSETRRNNNLFNLKEALLRDTPDNLCEISLIRWQPYFRFLQAFDRITPRKLENGLDIKKVVGGNINPGLLPNIESSKKIWQELMETSLIHDGEWSK